MSMLEGEAVLVRARSAGKALTVTVAVAELFVGFGSASVAVTVAVLLNGPATLGRTVMMMVGPTVIPSDPRLQVIGFVLVQVPAVVVTETIVTEAGRTSVMTTFVATPGPELFTLIV